MNNPKPFKSRTNADEVLSNIDLRDKNIVITGANSGIGFETARALSAAGANVIITCRDDSKGTKTVSDIKQQHPEAHITYQCLDLASVDSIKRFSANLSWDKIDTLICNAGIFPANYRETQEGLEQCVGVCHFGHFALCKLLLPKLLKTDTPRVVVVSSLSHTTPKRLSFNNLPLSKEKFSGLVAYGQAKLCNLLFAKELQRRYGDQGLSACSLHPGTLITTNIGRDSIIVDTFMKVISPFTKSPNQGAATTVYCAAYAEHSSIQGKYYNHCKEVKSSRESNNPEVATKLWEISEAFCEKHNVDVA